MLHVAMVKGQVEFHETVDGQFAPVQAGQKLPVGAEIRTGTSSVIAIYRDAFSIVILDQDSVMLVKKLEPVATDEPSPEEPAPDGGEGDGDGGGEGEGGE